MHYLTMCNFRQFNVLFIEFIHLLISSFVHSYERGITFTQWLLAISLFSEWNKCLIAISQQQWHQMCLLLRENVDEFVEISDTSTSDEHQKFLIAVTWLYNVDNVISLWPRDTPDIRASKLSDKGMVRVDEIQQLNTIHFQRAHLSFV